jgi:hypothetical protein
MSFNRAHYLRPVLESLMANPGIAGREVHLFQDGAVSPHTGTRVAEDAAIAESIRVFREVVPHGEVHAAPHNLGIANNFRRAERYVFLERGFDVVYFFEDDLVLSPHYLTMMDRMADWAVDNDRIAYFAAYGDQHASAEQQQEKHREVIGLGHHWGFGSKRVAWEKMNAFLDQYYYPYVENVDYKDRRKHKDKIFAGLKPLGVLPSIISQDAMKGLSMHVAGFGKAKTVACFGEYIGAEGVHFKPERFLQKGYGNTSVYPEPIDDLRFPGTETVDRWIARAQNNYERLWKAYFEPAPGEPTHEDLRQKARRASLRRA